MANPRDQNPIAVEKEYQALTNAIDKSRYREQIAYTLWPGASIKDFQDLLEQFKPNVLHFSGHATKVGDLIFQGSYDESEMVPLDPFIQAFQLLGNDLKLVVLSACYSKEQAEKIIQHIDCVIGMNKKINDNEAKTFSESFYGSIGNGISVGKAFEIAKNELALRNLRYRNLQILTKPRIKIDDIFLVESEDEILKKYLEWIISNISLKNDSIEDKYICNREVIEITNFKDWKSNNIIIRSKYERKDTEIVLKKFFDDPTKTCLIIGGPFGSGKTFLSKQISENYAKSILKDNTSYIPIYIEMRRGLTSIYNGMSFVRFLNMTLNNNRNKKILLILDGLDEYQNDIKKILEYDIDDYLKEFRNIKIICTTRINLDLPNIINLNEIQYIRLLPLSIDEVKNFMSKRKALTYNDALNIGLSEYDLTNPLFLDIICKIFPKLTNIFSSINLDQNTQNLINTTILYLWLFHSLVIGKNAFEIDTNLYDEDYKFDEEFIEKKVIFVLVLLYGQYNIQLSQMKIIELLQLLNINVTKRKLDSILNSYFYNLYNLYDAFIPSSLLKLITAEGYLQCFIDEKYIIFLNNIIPNNETINIFYGLLEIIKNWDIIKRFPISEGLKTHVFAHFNYREMPPTIKRDLISNAIKYINNIDLSFLKLENNNISKNYVNHIIENILSNKRLENIGPHNFHNSWILKWISLYLIVVIEPDIIKKEINKEKLRELILLTSHLIPYYLKIISQTDLSGMNLRGADLSRVNLRGADLRRADLSRVNLTGADLADVNLEVADLTGADLTGADLTGADLTGADLAGGDLAGVNLTGAESDRS